MSEHYKFLDIFFDYLKESFNIRTIRIEVKPIHTIDAKVLGKFIKELDVEGFIKIVPQIELKLLLITDALYTEIIIVDNKVHDYKKRKIHQTCSDHLITISFKINDEREIIENDLKLIQSKYEVNNQISIWIGNKRISENMDNDDDSIAYDEDCRNLTNSLIRTMSYSINSAFRERCSTLLESEHLSMEQNLLKKLKKLKAIEENNSTFK